jgi:hypothetical protein
LLRPEQPLCEYRWSTWPEYLKSPGKRPEWLRVDRLLGEYHVAKASSPKNQPRRIGWSSSPSSSQRRCSSACRNRRRPAVLS